MSLGRDFTVVRGDDYQQPFTVVLDQDRALDGTESWTFTVRKTKAGSELLSLTKSAGQILIDPLSFQPTVQFLSSPATLLEANFPIDEDDVPYWYDLQMVKDSQLQTVALARMIVVSDLTR